MKKVTAFVGSTCKKNTYNAVEQVAGHLMDAMTATIQNMI